MNKPIFGLQLFPFDVRDEGLDTVLELSTGAALANTLLPAVSYIEERQPQPAGRLPHNPVHGSHVTSPGFYFEPDWDLYPAELQPVRSSEKAGERELSELKRACLEADVTFVPWLQLLAGSFHAAEASPWVVNAAGEDVPGWLCPWKPATRRYVAAAVADVLRRFQPTAIFVDRFRYPEWGPHGAIDACCCFCEDCQREALARGLNLAALSLRLNRAVDHLINASESGLGPGFPDSLATALPLLAGQRAWLDWLQFRAEGVTGCIAAAHSAARSEAELWLDIWPPTYGGLLGQDISTLTEYGSLVKSFAYHRLGGGASVAGYIRALGRSSRARQDLYERYLRVFGVPGPERFEQFENEGLSVSFVTEETARTVRLAHPLPVCAGVQIFQVGPEGVRESLDAARRAHPAGYIMYAYGWASHEELSAAGEWWAHELRRGAA